MPTAQGRHWGPKWRGSADALPTGRPKTLHHPRLQGPRGALTGLLNRWKGSHK